MASDRRKTKPVSVAFSRKERVMERWLPPASPDGAAFTGFSSREKPLPAPKKEEKKREIKK